MSNSKLALAVFIMAIVTYIVRMIPLTFFRKKITNPHIKAFLNFIPYAVLGSMIFPDVFYSTGNIISATLGVIVAFILAYKGRDLLTVSLFSCVVVFLTNLVLI